MENDKENREATTTRSVLSKLHVIPMTDCPPALIGYRVEYFHSNEAQTVDELIRAGITEDFRIGFKMSKNRLWINPEPNTPDGDHDIPIALLSSEITWLKSSVTKFHDESAARGQVQDLFSEDFLMQSLKDGILKNLNSYRLYPTRFEKYDANDILHGRRKWSDLKLLPQMSKAPRERAPRPKRDRLANYKVGEIVVLPGSTSTVSGTSTRTHSSVLQTILDSNKPRLPPVPLFMATNTAASTWNISSANSTVPVAPTPLDSVK